MSVKKFIFPVIIASLMLLVACSDENKRTEGTNQGTIDEAQLVSVVNQVVDQGDQIEAAQIEDRKILVQVDLAPHDIIAEELMAQTFYSSLSKELLRYEGWTLLTVEFQHLGERIALNYSESELDPLGERFFSLKRIEAKYLED